MRRGSTNPFGGVGPPPFISFPGSPLPIHFPHCCPTTFLRLLPRSLPYTARRGLRPNASARPTGAAVLSHRPGHTAARCLICRSFFHSYFFINYLFIIDGVQNGSLPELDSLRPATVSARPSVPYGRRARALHMYFPPASSLWPG